MCDKDFETVSIARKYCSDGCKQKAYRKNKQFPKMGT